MTPDIFARRLNEIRDQLLAAFDSPFGPSEAYVLSDEIREVGIRVREAEAARVASRLLGERLVSMTPKRAPTFALPRAKPRRHESPARWGQAMRAFRGRIQ